MISMEKQNLNQLASCIYIKNTHTHIHTHTHTHTHTDIHISFYIYTYIHIHIYIERETARRSGLRETLARKVTANIVIILKFKALF